VRWRVGASSGAEEAELAQIAESLGERRAVDRSETLSENPSRARRVR